MIRDNLRSVGRRLVRREPPLRYDMFDLETTAEAAKSAAKLERIYHKGQEKAWDGKDLLPQLIAKHGGIDLPPEQVKAVRALFGVILWGELAAWKISADLAVNLVPLGPKMAATSQAHDEARHFYVMHDYLAALSEVPTQLGPRTRRVLEGTIQADSLVKKLLGMQLMIEPMALTLFQVVRRARLEPVLCDLLVYYERDEARHVALGVLHLPEMLAGMNRRQATDLYAWQIREYFAQFAMLAELKDDFAAVGISPREVLEVGRQKQMLALQMMCDQFGTRLPVIEAFRRVIDFKAELDFPEPGQRVDLPSRLGRAVKAAFASAEAEGVLSEVAQA